MNLLVLGAVLLGVLLIAIFLNSITQIPSNTVTPVLPLTEGGTSTDLGNFPTYPIDLYPAVNVSFGDTMGTKFIIKNSAIYPIPSNFTFMDHWSFCRFSPDYVTISSTHFSNDTATCITGGGFNQVFGNVPIQQGERVIFSVVINVSSGLLESEGVGVGTILSNPLSYLGADSIGFYDDGVYSTPTVSGSGFTTFSGIDNILDMAVDTVANKLWYRVNGQAWQG